jgi:hypothetical protein
LPDRDDASVPPDLSVNVAVDQMQDGQVRDQGAPDGPLVNDAKGADAGIDLPADVRSWADSADMVDLASTHDAAVDANLGRNLALHQSVTASSSYETSLWSLAMVTNGERQGRGWSTSGQNDPKHAEWVQVDLGAKYVLTTVVLYPRTDLTGQFGYGFPIDFTIAVSNDLTAWKTAYAATGYPRPVDGLAQIFTFPAVSGRYLKITGTLLCPNPNDGYLYRMQLAEIEAYGSGS